MGFSLFLFYHELVCFLLIDLTVRFVGTHLVCKKFHFYTDNHDSKDLYIDCS